MHTTVARLLRLLMITTLLVDPAFASALSARPASANRAPVTFLSQTLAPQLVAEQLRQPLLGPHMHRLIVLLAVSLLLARGSSLMGQIPDSRPRPNSYSRAIQAIERHDARQINRNSDEIRRLARDATVSPDARAAARAVVRQMTQQIERRSEALGALEGRFAGSTPSLRAKALEELRGPALCVEAEMAAVEGLKEVLSNPYPELTPQAIDMAAETVSQLENASLVFDLMKRVIELGLVVPELSPKIDQFFERLPHGRLAPTIIVVLTDYTHRLGESVRDAAKDDRFFYAWRLYRDQYRPMTKWFRSYDRREYYRWTRESGLNPLYGEINSTLLWLVAGFTGSLIFYVIRRLVALPANDLKKFARFQTLLSESGFGNNHGTPLEAVARLGMNERLPSTLLRLFYVATLYGKAVDGDRAILSTASLSVKAIDEALQFAGFTSIAHADSVRSFSSNSTDVVIYHEVNPDRSAWAETFRVLRPGKWLLVKLLAGPPDHHAPKILSDIREEGFEIIHVVTGTGMIYAQKPFLDWRGMLKVRRTSILRQLLHRRTRSQSPQNLPLVDA